MNDGAVEARRCKAMAVLAAFSAREQVHKKKFKFDKRLIEFMNFAVCFIYFDSNVKQAWPQLSESRTLRRVVDLLSAAPMSSSSSSASSSSLSPSSSTSAAQSGVEAAARMAG